MWIADKDKPQQHGYYLTFYFNPEHNDYWFKAFWWNRKKWMFRFEPKVICYWNRVYEFYIPCQFQGDVAPLPEWVLI